MKYETVTKRERNQEILWLHKLRPELSLKEIGERYGITPQRVFAILKKYSRS